MQTRSFEFFPGVLLVLRCFQNVSLQFDFLLAMHFRRYLWLPGWRATGTSCPQACARDGVSVTPSSYMLHVEGTCISWEFWKKRFLKRNINKWLKASRTSFFAGSSTRTSCMRYQQLRRQRLLNPSRFWGRVFERKLSHVHDRSLERRREGQIQSHLLS